MKVNEYEIKSKLIYDHFKFLWPHWEKILLSHISENESLQL